MKARLKTEEEKKDSCAPISLVELPKSTINVVRTSLNERTLKDVDIYKERTTIGQGTFGYLY
jgi:hypothetical protein